MINIVKQQPAPACLALEAQKKAGNYNCGDVWIRLVAEFHNKCYVCEEKDSSSLVIEHFRPHLNGKHHNLKFDWNNLFLCCTHCNGIKLAKYSNILDCTNASPIIVDVIEFKIAEFPKSKACITAKSEDGAVIETALLLNEVYNGTTLQKSTEAENIRKKIQAELRDFNASLLKYYYTSGLSAEDKADLKIEIRQKLSIDSAFTAFKIWAIKSNDEIFAEFGDLLPKF